MSGFHDNVLLGASGSQGYQISRSVRLRSSASGNFTRTPATTTNQQTFTLSFWSKRGSIGGTDQTLFCFGNGGGSGLAFEVYWGNSNTELVTRTLNIGIAATWEVASSQVFRDPSAWYHIVIAVDTTQATNTNRVKMYANNVQITSFRLSNWPTQNYNTGANTNTQHRIGVRADGVQYLDGYLTEVNFIDGQALTPSSFGETNTVTGVWQPKKYAGTYGTNGFYLNFSDNSAATAAAIGKDYSGNGNNWTPNNISVTAGATYDSMLDVPTQWADGGNGRGNYCVANPLDKGANSVAANGNLDISSNNGTRQGIKGTLGVSTGKWYFEYTKTTAASASVGVASAETAFAADSNVGSSATSWGYLTTGSKLNNNSSSAYGATWTTNDVIGVAFDMDAGTITFYKNNSSQGQAFSGLTGTVFPMGYNGSATADIFNFGQRPFAYTPPTGFKALNTLNLPTPTILKGNQYFDATLYSGNNANPRSITGLSFQPDLVWVKQRTANGGGFTAHQLYDAVRGTQNLLRSNTTDAELSNPANGGVQSFNADGFTIQGSSASINMNNTGETYVGWQWKEGATQGFDIVTYTGTGANRTVAHNLGVAPSMIITKGRDSVAGATNWKVYHASLGNTKNLNLNLTNAEAVSSTVWNNTSPTSSVFSLGTSGDVNANTATYVAYLFAEVAGFSKFGSYTGNGSADGPFLNLGFRPALIIVKSATEVDSWRMYDKSRIGYNSSNYVLYPNLSNAEGASTDHFDLLSNGAKIRSNNNNTNGQTYIYAAFAESPFKNSLAR